MAESAPPPAAPTPTQQNNSPVLGSTADTAAYVPVSWMAVAAGGVACLFLLVLLIAGYDSFKGHRPLIQPWILILPMLTIVLSFAARRVVRNSEGTRTGQLFGIDLVSYSWWCSLVVGLGYMAYLFAIDFAVRRDAESEVQKWTASVIKGEYSRAFHRTLEPGRRREIDPTNENRMMAEFRDPFTAFRQSDIVRLAERNSGNCEFVPGGLRDWVYRPNGIECIYAGTIVCPEGKFPLHISMRGVEPGTGAGTETAAGRQWSIIPTGSGFIQREGILLTDYGWLVNDLERQGSDFGVRCLQLTNMDRLTRIQAVLKYMHTENDPYFSRLNAASVNARMGAIGALAAHPWIPEQAYYQPYLDETARRLFRLNGGGTPSADQLRRIDFAWANMGLVKPGSRLRESPDVAARMIITDSVVEVYLPAEIPLPSSGQISAYRARAVFACTDPELLAELKTLRAAAKPETLEPGKPIVFPAPRKPLPWKLVRIETDFQPITVQQPGPPGAPPGAPGMGAPGMAGPPSGS